MENLNLEDLIIRIENMIEKEKSHIEFLKKQLKFISDKRDKETISSFILRSNINLKYLESRLQEYINFSKKITQGE